MGMDTVDIERFSFVRCLMNEVGNDYHDLEMC